MYKSYMNYEKTRKLVRILLIGYKLENTIQEDIITDIIDKAEIDNLDKKTLDNIIEGHINKIRPKKATLPNP